MLTNADLPVIENSSLWKKDIYALNHYFLKERPHLSKNDDAMLIMTVFNLYSLWAVTIFFLKTSALFYEQRAINRWSTGTVHKYLFFSKGTVLSYWQVGMCQTRKWYLVIRSSVLCLNTCITKINQCNLLGGKKWMYLLHDGH